jgi:hypothetical protein
LKAEPLLVALFAGPGTGKSTTAAEVFAMLKHAAVNCELVGEVAKDLTWEERWVARASQPYVTAKQMFRYDRLRGKVDCIVTDTSTLLGLVYGENNIPAFEAWLIDDYKRRETLNIFLQRDPDRPYEPNGRRESMESAQGLDVRIKSTLIEHGIEFTSVEMGAATAPRIFQMTMERLGRR